jgi:hypothetical protein
MREAKQVKPPLRLQVAHPPDWLPEAHTSADLGTSIVLGSFGIHGRCGRTAHGLGVGHALATLRQY